jgi:hypothetical protein
MLRFTCTALLVVAFAGAHAALTAAQSEPDGVTAHAVAHSAILALGGEDALAAIRILDMDIRGHELILDAFEQEGGPKPVEYDEIRHILDFEGKRTRLRKAVYIASERPGRVMTFVTAPDLAAMLFAMPDGNERTMPARKLDLMDGHETLALHPLRLLHTALAAPDLKRHADAVQDGRATHHLSFTWEGLDVHVHLDAATDLPYVTEVRGARPYDFSWAMWGDLTVRTTWYNWVQHASGFRIPYQWDIARNGMPYMSRMIVGMRVNPELEAGLLDIPDGIREAWDARESAGPPPLTERIQVADGVTVVVTEFFPAVVVEQEDGLVLVETPISPASTQHLLMRMAERWPDKPVKAAVVAANALTQFGGVAALAEAGIPVYVSADSEPVFDALVAAHTGRPDWQVTYVSQPTPIGQGPNRLEVHPGQGVNTGRTLLAFFPEHGLLYGGSTLFPPGMTLTSSHARWEIQAAVERAGWDVRNAFSMFMPLTAWE